MDLKDIKYMQYTLQYSPIKLHARLWAVDVVGCAQVVRKLAQVLHSAVVAFDVA